MISQPDTLIRLIFLSAKIKPMPVSSSACNARVLWLGITSETSKIAKALAARRGYREGNAISPGRGENDLNKIYARLLARTSVISMLLAGEWRCRRQATHTGDGK